MSEESGIWRLDEYKKISVTVIGLSLIVVKNKSNHLIRSKV